MENIKKKVLEAYLGGKIRSDGDIEDLADEHGVGYDNILKIIAKKIHKNTICGTCQDVVYRMFNAQSYPCNECSRVVILKDHYKKESEDE